MLGFETSERLRDPHRVGLTLAMFCGTAGIVGTACFPGGLIAEAFVQRAGLVDFRGVAPSRASGRLSTVTVLNLGVAERGATSPRMSVTVA